MTKTRRVTPEEQRKMKNPLLEGVAFWTDFYRKNPHRFVEEYLNINLKLFQKILLYMMMVMNYFMFIASRGRGLSHMETYG